MGKQVGERKDEGVWTVSDGWRGEMRRPSDGFLHPHAPHSVVGTSLPCNSTDAADVNLVHLSPHPVLSPRPYHLLSIFVEELLLSVL